MGRALWALGAMSGTSLDGVDACAVQTDGERVLEIGRGGYRPYSEPERAVLRAALGRWEGPEVEAAAQVVLSAHAELLADFPEAELVGFHGQTLAHAPHEGRTLQVGDGAALAAALGRTVVWDFRSADVALGGQGAPLAPFYHFALARALGADAPLAVLNLGGVGNLTWIDPAAPAPEAPGALLAFDTGPANAPLDDLLRTRRGEPCDTGGALALSGRADADRVATALEAGYYRRIPPKSLDRLDFAALAELVAPLPDADAAATLVAVVAGAVAAGLEHCPAPPAEILVTGGGRRNPALMAALSAACPCTVRPVETVGWDGDLLEAQAFAHLAVRVLNGLPTSCPGTTGVAAAVGGGQVSRP